MSTQLGNHFIGQVFAQRAVPATTGCFYSVRPVTLGGTQGESNPGSLTVNSSATVLVYVMGGRPPVAGDNLVCHEIRSITGIDATRLAYTPAIPTPFYVAEPLILNGGGIVVTGCSCDSLISTSNPDGITTLSMTSSNPTANNGMFQNATLVWGPTPVAYAGLPIGAYSFLSDGSFTDQFNNVFRYFYYCQRNQFFLTRVYVNSIFGSPYEDTVRYTWTFGTDGNTCDPFSLTNGRIYAGGDTSVVVTITG